MLGFGSIGEAPLGANGGSSNTAYTQLITYTNNTSLSIRRGTAHLIASTNAPIQNLARKIGRTFALSASINSTLTHQTSFNKVVSFFAGTSTVIAPLKAYIRTLQNSVSPLATLQKGTVTSRLFTISQTSNISLGTQSLRGILLSVAQNAQASLLKAAIIHRNIALSAAQNTQIQSSQASIRVLTVISGPIATQSETQVSFRQLSASSVANMLLTEQPYRGRIIAASSNTSPLTFKQLALQRILGVSAAALVDLSRGNRQIAVVIHASIAGFYSLLAQVVGTISGTPKVRKAFILALQRNAIIHSPRRVAHIEEGIMVSWPNRFVTDELNYDFDWTGQPGFVGEVIDQVVSCEVTQGSVVLDPSKMTNSFSAVTVYLSGGQPGELSVVTCIIRTLSGLEFTGEVSIRTTA